MDGELDRDLIEAPAQAQPDVSDRERVERRSEVQGRFNFDVWESGSRITPTSCVDRKCRASIALRQCEQMPAISITGLFGAKPAARDRRP